jgi:hypothetical protein
MAGKVKEDDPQRSNNPEYLGNHTIKTESGIVIELDNTPDNRSIRILHPAGTFFQVKDDGSIIMKMGNKDAKVQQFFEGTFDQIVNKAAKIVFGGPTEYEYKGDVKMVINGNLDLTVTKDLVTKVNGMESREVIGSQRIQVNGDTSHRTTMNRHTFTGQNHNMETTEKLSIGATAVQIEAKSDAGAGSMKLEAEQEMEIKTASGGMGIVSGKELSIGSVKTMYLNSKDTMVQQVETGPYQINVNGGNMNTTVSENIATSASENISITAQQATDIHGLDAGVTIAGGQVTETSAEFLPG